MSPGRRQARTVGKFTVRPQKNTAAKPAASSQLPKTTPHTEAGPANVVPGETKAEPSGAQNNPSQPPETAPHSEAVPANIPDETKAEPSGAPNNVDRGAEGLSWHKVYVSLSFSMWIPSWICCGRADNSSGKD